MKKDTKLKKKKKLNIATIYSLVINKNNFCSQLFKRYGCDILSYKTYGFDSRSCKPHNAIHASNAQHSISFR